MARSTGAVTNVVGTAERKPAVANSGMDRASDVRFGVSAKISFFETSYAYDAARETALARYRAEGPE